MSQPNKLLFLPGARGEPAFWHALGECLHHDARKVYLAYPGFGSEPTDPSIKSLDDLVQAVIRQIDQPTAIIAQSMGGILAMRAALAKPELVTHLVLSVTSGGVDMRAFDAHDWRADFAAANPNLPLWFLHDRSDLSSEMHRITQPTLLLWGDSDPISPLAAGEHLRALLSRATLHVVAGGGHDLAHVHAAQLAPLVDGHLQP